MLMSDGDIVNNYRQAKNHKAQVGILADLNGVPHTEMEVYLERLGCIKATPEPAFDWLRAAELYAEGKCDLDIAEQLGCKKSAVARWRQRKKLHANYPKGTSIRPAKPKPKPKPVPKLQSVPVPVEPVPAEIAPVQGMNVAALAVLLAKIAEGFPDAQVVTDSGAIASVYVSILYGADADARETTVRLMEEGIS